MKKVRIIIAILFVLAAAIAVIGLFGSDIKNSFMRSGEGLRGPTSTKANTTTYDTRATDFSNFDSNTGGGGDQRVPDPSKIK